MRAYLFILISVSFLAGTMVWAEPTFADLAVVVAKQRFKQHVPADATVAECVSVLNEHGVYFSLFDLLDPEKQVTKEDCARALGQSHLLFIGEAVISDEGIKRSNDIKMWVDYCLLNDINIDSFWASFVRRTEEGSLSEVDHFFGRR